MSNTHPYPMEDIVVLLCAAKQNTLFWCYVDVPTWILSDQNAECKNKHCYTDLATSAVVVLEIGP